MEEYQCQVLHTYSCYDILPLSFKLIVFDNTLLVKKALSALVQHGVQSAPIWDSSQQRYVGMLTVTDFIRLILYYFESSASLESALAEIDKLTISALRDLERDVLKCLPTNSITIHPSESLCEASKLLLNNQLHRLPLIDSTPTSDTIVSVLTQSKILRFIAANEVNQTLLEKTIGELGLGTFENLITIEPSTQLIEILLIFIDKRISSVPIVDSDGTVLDVFEKYDVLVFRLD